MNRWRLCAHQLKGLIHALYLAYRDPRTPWFARIVAVCVVGYALSPIDLIPDFIPIIGYLDDLILIPLGVMLAVKLIPEAIWRDAQEQSRITLGEGKPINRIVAGFIIAVWLGLAIGTGLTVWRWR